MMISKYIKAEKICLQIMRKFVFKISAFKLSKVKLMCFKIKTTFFNLKNLISLCFKLKGLNSLYLDRELNWMKMKK